ncbi:MAG: FxsA family protein [Sulfuricella denitrificans]|nr:FxsA family protein [Sulfuricella denitrificans]
MQLLIVFIILLGFPALEIVVLFRLADSIGWWLLPWLILSAVAGWALIQEERLAMFARLFSSLQSGQPLGFAMLDSLRTLFAGVLLIFPGVISDVLAVILLLLPRTKVPHSPVRENSEEIIIEGEWQREDDPRLK